MSHASADSEVSIGKDHMRCVGAGWGTECAARTGSRLRVLARRSPCRPAPMPFWDASPPALDRRLPPRNTKSKTVPERQNAFRDASCPRTGFGHSGTPGGRPGHAATHSGPPCVPARPKPMPERPKAVPKRQKPFRNAAVPKRPKPVPERHAFRNVPRRAARHVLKWPFYPSTPYPVPAHRNPARHRFCASLKRS